MTIDKLALTTGLALLGGAHGREIDGATVRMYFSVLSPQLTTDQVNTAIERSLAADTYWPSPAVLLNHVRAPDAASRALAAVIDQLR